MIFFSNPKAKWSKFTGLLKHVRIALTKFETRFDLFQFFIRSRCIAPGDLYTFPLIMEWCASFNSLQVMNKLVASFLIFVLNKNPLTKKQYL